MNYDLLLELLSINSYSTNKDGISKKIEIIQRELSGLGLSFKRSSHPEYGDFLRIDSPENGKPKIGLVLHSDTVHEPDSNVPIRFSNDGKKLFGPGVADMQASIFAVIRTIQDLAESNMLHDISIVINPCEEKGSPAYTQEMKAFAKEMDYVLVYEKADDAGLDPSNHAFLKTYALASSRKGIFQQTVSLKGPGGHSGELSNPSKRNNVIAEAVRIMSEIDALSDFAKGTTVNLAYVSGGRKNTVISEDCEFTFDVRFSLESERNRVKDAVSSILSSVTNTKLQVTDHGFSYDLPSWESTEKSEQFSNTVQEIGSRLGYAIKSFARGGWSDACNLYEFDPSLIIVDGLGPKGDGEHSETEFIYVDTIPYTIQLTHNIIELLHYE